MVLCLTSMLSPSFSILFDRKNFFISDRCEKEETLQHNLVFRLGQRQVFAFDHLPELVSLKNLKYDKNLGKNQFV